VHTFVLVLVAFFCFWDDNNGRYVHSGGVHTSNI
jgi:hypothetical protein